MDGQGHSRTVYAADLSVLRGKALYHHEVAQTLQLQPGARSGCLGTCQVAPQPTKVESVMSADRNSDSRTASSGTVSATLVSCRHLARRLRHMLRTCGPCAQRVQRPAAPL
jgi:hypothetical protein